MSKKKTTTRAHKELRTHHLEHLERVITVAPAKSEAGRHVAEKQKTVGSPLANFVAKDLRNTLITIAVFVLIITILGFLTYKTELINSLLSRWNIKY